MKHEITSLSLLCWTESQHDHKKQRLNCVLKFGIHSKLKSQSNHAEAIRLFNEHENP